ncbi:hypothetical protein PVAND_001764 [Polypedilum vanderplanki]|uniref:Potassium channel domain-containing protein n=1 Tax=Polypedilum vanderplanki TaxID=319348 RepID=A0A9J6BQ72_POLVA|nr:hypothetical protein PVAND_001764 [Polypedilum vanderplanki]
MNRQRSSVRSSRGSNSTSNGSDPREKFKDCCRKFAVFMCTQVGVGALIISYALIGALIFEAIEGKANNTEIVTINETRRILVSELWEVVEDYNTLNTTAFIVRVNDLLFNYQLNFTESVKRGYEQKPPGEIWTYPASLMFCLSVFSMIGYGNIVPKTKWGKVLTMVYATFGIPLYILYFVSMGKVLASTFKWVYTWMHDCSNDSGNANSSEEGSSLQLPKTKKKIIVPSTACLWVISIYIAGGTVMFAEWENWSYTNSAYFVSTSLCKIGFGDFNVGKTRFIEKNGTMIADLNDSSAENHSKLVINFIFILFGMALVAMCYILMREEVREKYREIKEDTKMCMEDVSAKFAKCFGTTNIDDEYEEKYF